ncbi:uncharacterized protein J4E92_008811 [Alternaria infectoria]|uniref:uncharacterized protein n=1 Tax=Alternaria infectoria TaxID=45303 RepID=UPI00221F2882|nr:uncharacterized protein J4E92_008811 [Alternaria infectoria]KAI4917874.1 hypothetical protein J4E92_008811 [Alternaria infectoria]
MRSTLVTTVLVGASVVSAKGLLDLPTDIANLLTSLAPAPASDPRWTNWHPASSGDVRSPCPGLNALANHDFIHRNGRNMTIPHLIAGLAAGLNMGADFTTAIGAAGLLSSPNPLGGSFDLDDLSMHNFPIEHDASMSRQDAYFANPQPFHNPTWQQYISFFDGKERTDIPTASKAKYARTLDSQKRNPEFVYGAREAVLSYGENALYLSTMGDPVTGKAKLEYVRSMFEQEKLPFELGWRPSVLPTTLVSLGLMVVELQSSGPEPLPEGLKIVA